MFDEEIAYINDNLIQHDQDLLEACSRRYNSLFAYYKNKYKKIRRRKIALDLTIFFISSGGIAGSIVTATPVIALITAVVCELRASRHFFFVYCTKLLWIDCSFASLIRNQASLCSSPSRCAMHIKSLNSTKSWIPHHL